MSRPARLLASKCLGLCLRARYPAHMRSTDPHPTPAQRFGRLITEAAERAGYDLRPGAGGRVALARAVGMAPSGVGRMLDGKTLPRPSQFEAIAAALGLDVRALLIQAEIISAGSWTNSTGEGVRSVITPEEAADSWGITNPLVRKMLLANIQQAMRLQAESDTEGEGGGAATAKG